MHALLDCRARTRRALTTRVEFVSAGLNAYVVAPLKRPLVRFLRNANHDGAGLPPSRCLACYPRPCTHKQAPLVRLTRPATQFHTRAPRSTRPAAQALISACLESRGILGSSTSSQARVQHRDTPKEMRSSWMTGLRSDGALPAGSPQALWTPQDRPTVSTSLIDP